MNTDLDSHVTELAQKCVESVPVILLGSGASAAHGLPGMQALAEHLVNTVTLDGSDPAETEAWARFKSKISTVDLETALTGVTIPDSLTKRIICSTWDLLSKNDIDIFAQVVENRSLLPLSRLLTHLFRSARSEIEIVTPNYDRLAEYAAEAVGICHHTGFNHGHLRLRSLDNRQRITENGKMARTANIWKVHGSLDWFVDAQHVVVGLPISPIRLPGLMPVIVTPGLDKYRRTHEEPFRSILSGADNALSRASSYLCIGYGFNDPHLQSKLVGRCESNSTLIVVITKELSFTAKELLSSGRCRRYLALEESPLGTRVYSHQYPNGAELVGCSIWQLSKFIDLVI
ncbi:SIR2 family protein [Methylobacterium sp.]|uniref:SIR2 family protein n=1 Tax=Methylobacterium sp. TaxID=409 RepID=UPI003B020DBE